MTPLTSLNAEVIPAKNSAPDYLVLAHGLVGPDNRVTLKPPFPSVHHSPEGHFVPIPTMHYNIQS
ncbi:Uncharacterised protein [Yersinia enterocolitica]|nr:Uncharacterised protein [Yersinia enterocolitica]CNF59569.1 Uncharacterised protein [Yersinia enterocolitica]